MYATNNLIKVELLWSLNPLKKFWAFETKNWINNIMRHYLNFWRLIQNNSSYKTNLKTERVEIFWIWLKIMTGLWSIISFFNLKKMVFKLSENCYLMCIVQIWQYRNFYPINCLVILSDKFAYVKCTNMKI